MSTSINLKELERKAFLRTYEDGLYEIYLGGMLISFSVFAFNIFPGETFESITALVLYLCGMALSGLVYWLGKKYITLPRIGLVKFGQPRQKRTRDLVVVLSIIVGVQVMVVLLQFGVLAIPTLHARVAPYLGDPGGMQLIVAIAAALFVAPGMLMIAYFTEIPGGYYHAAVLSIAIFMMIIFNQAWWMVAGGFFILLPGVVHFVRFLQKYPLPSVD